MIGVVTLIVVVGTEEWWQEHEQEQEKRLNRLKKQNMGVSPRVFTYVLLERKYRLSIYKART